MKNLAVLGVLVGLLSGSFLLPSGTVNRGFLVAARVALVAAATAIVMPREKRIFTGVKESFELRESEQNLIAMLQRLSETGEFRVPASVVGEVKADMARPDFTSKNYLALLQSNAATGGLELTVTRMGLGQTKAIFTTYPEIWESFNQQLGRS